MPANRAEEEGSTHDGRVIRQVLSDMDRIARQVGQTQGLPPGKRRATQTEEDAAWDYVDPKGLAEATARLDQVKAEIEAALAAGQIDTDRADRYLASQVLKVAPLIYPKRLAMIRSTRPTMTEQAKFAGQMAGRAERRYARQQMGMGSGMMRPSVDMNGMAEAEPPDPMVDNADTMASGY